MTAIGFWELISSVDKIEIPIIQRDFAQGRSNKKTTKIRGLFLDSLIKAIEPENSPIELDFIYGDIKNRVFQPLDGQQRLTTLFLLYWYFAYRTGNLSGTKGQYNIDQFKKFTYETRISSREFCSELVGNREGLGEGETLIEKIKDACWFFLSWEKDPTIKAMLVMLNSIESRLKNKSEEKLGGLWEKLTSEKPPITFYFLELKNIGLTDDLYIKMNARGKALTAFENFKARFEKHIEEKGFEEALSPQDIEKKFSHKIDTVWADLFWKYLGESNVIDNGFIKFIAGVAINSYADPKNQEIFESEEEDKKTKKLLEEKNQNATKEAVKRERIERRIALLSNNPNEIIPEDFPSKQSFTYLKDCFDIYSPKEHHELKPQDLKLWDLSNNNLFLDLIKDANTVYKQRVLFYAQTQFLLKDKIFNSTSFAEWMRVVRNIVQNTTIDSAGTYMGAIGLIKEFSEGCNDIYSYLRDKIIKPGFFASEQVREEILKSSIILTNEESKKNIFSTEDTNFFKGRILFGLYCIGFKERVGDFNNASCNALKEVCENHLHDPNISAKFSRALLTIGDNNFYEYWRTWSYGTDSHKRCFIKDTADLKKHFTIGENRKYLKGLLEKFLEGKTLDDIISEYERPQNMPIKVKTLHDIISKYERSQNMPNWKWRIIKEAPLLEEHCQSRYFGISKDNNTCYLFRDKKRPKSIEDCEKVE